MPPYGESSRRDIESYSSAFENPGRVGINADWYKALLREMVRRRLAEDDLKPRCRDMWCIAKVDGAYVARVEDVLDLYAEEADPKRPVVCFNESQTQPIGEVREPILASRSATTVNTP
jgi:hypothetical protein